MLVMSYFINHRRCSLLLIALLNFLSMLSQDSLVKISNSKKWHFKTDPYLMFPSMTGNTGVQALPLVEVDANASDIFSKLSIGGMLYLEASSGSWSINSDLLFMNLEQDVTPSKLINNGKINAKQLGWELAGLRSVNP